MTGMDGLDLDEIGKIVIKYDQIYTPNQDVCPGKSYSTFKEMQDNIGYKLEAASDCAFANHLPFQPYSVKHTIKPEFTHEILDNGVKEVSD